MAVPKQSGIIGINRRQLVGGGVAASIIPLLKPGIGSANKWDLDSLDPFAPLTKTKYQRLRSTFRDPADGSLLVRSLWEKYDQTNNFDYAHWAVLYCQLWWQALPAGKERLKVSQIALTLAENLRTSYPDHPAGAFWGAVHLGFEALVRGVLDSLNMIPRFFELLDEAEAIDSSYLVGSVYLAKAKAYFKLPTFPMSIGSMKKGYHYLELAQPYQEKTYALWHVVRAEAEMMRNGRDAAFAALDGIQNVCPIDMQTQYTYEIGTWFAEKFRIAAASGSYNKYTWDPMLEPILEMRDRPPVYADC